jgi:ABC-type antimicrobial peptide transport system permease subunit
VSVQEGLEVAHRRWQPRRLLHFEGELASGRPIRPRPDGEQGLRVREHRRNPLIAAGGSGILLISFAAVLVLVAAALLVSLMTSLGRRKTEFAVVRSMGVSRGQLFRMLALEYSVVAVAGTAVGAFLGLVVGRQMLSFLNVTENGTKVEPGFILQTQWLLVAGSVGLVFAVFAAALVLATFVMAAIADAQALRTE